MSGEQIGDRIQNSQADTASNERNEDEDGGSAESVSTEQSKKPHMQSEQKRRQLLRDRFKELQQLVPSLQDKSNKQNKSEAVILQKTVDYLNEMITKRDQLQATVADLTQQVNNNAGKY
ncbi:hypothetical protein MP228_011549 [Amoeboaphelidium protococcarum]|nr:hypothetical protein MP228_011549 [Amoeboaphelidium protococcarum]